jgi:putative membrane protein
LWLAWELGLGSRFDADLWFWTKLVAVLGLLAVHGMLAQHVRAFASGLRPHGARYYRVLNEVPTLLMVVIVVMVVVRPY